MGSHIGTGITDPGRFPGVCRVVQNCGQYKVQTGFELGQIQDLTFTRLVPVIKSRNQGSSGRREESNLDKGRRAEEINIETWLRIAACIQTVIQANVPPVGLYLLACTSP